jgi:transcriptional regulator with XRE-family HTH domain
LLLKNIKEICKEKKISVASVELNLGFARGYIAKWDEIDPGFSKVKKVADYLHVKLDRLVQK